MINNKLKMETTVKVFRCFVDRQIWGDSDSLALAQSLGIDNSLKSLSSVTDPPKVSGPSSSKRWGTTHSWPVYYTRPVLTYLFMIFKPPHLAASALLRFA